MRILHISTYDRGGAGKACIRLHQGLMKEGIDSNVLFLHKPISTVENAKGFDRQLNGAGFDILTFLRKRIYYSRQKKILKGKIEGYERFSFPDTPYRFHRHPTLVKADIVHLHWVADFLDYRSFFQNVQQPVVWTLHDMNPFTGGCHYPDGCISYQDRCAKCPQLQGTFDPAYSATILEKKLSSIRPDANLTIVSISNWMREASSLSRLFSRFKHYVLRNGVNSRIFKPIDQGTARKRLGIPPDKKVILFLSESLKNKRKGFEYLKKAVTQLNDRNDFIVCVIGGDTQKRDQEPFFELGYFTDDQMMVAAFSSADVFVIPSIEDNFPNTVIESLLCGTPVIGFPVGGIREMILPDENGSLCSEVSVNALKDEIEKYLINSNRFDRTRIREEAVKKYDIQIQVDNYLQLYKKVLNNSTH